MFESRKQEYAVDSPQEVKDKYNYGKTTYVPQGTAKIYIVVQDRTLISNNDLNTYTATLVGYTDDLRIDKNWRVDGRYVVTSTMPHRTEQVIYLKEITNGK